MGKVRPFRSSLTAPPAGAGSSASSPASGSAPNVPTRFIVTNLAGSRAKALYEDLYCRRAAAENHIKSWKTHLAADRTSCTKAMANQFRRLLLPRCLLVDVGLADRKAFLRLVLDRIPRLVTERRGAHAPQNSPSPGGRRSVPSSSAAATRSPLEPPKHHRCA